MKDADGRGGGPAADQHLGDRQPRRVPLRGRRGARSGKLSRSIRSRTSETDGRADPTPIAGADAAARLAEFARACKAAARAVSLYPGGHPAIATSLGAPRAVDGGAHRAADRIALQVIADKLLIEGATMPKPDAAIARARRPAAPSSHRRADAESRAPTRSPGARCSCCWPAPPKRSAPTAGSSTCGPRPADRASRSKRSTTPRSCARSRASPPTVEQILAAARSGATLELDDSGMRLLLDIVQDPTKLEDLMAQLDTPRRRHGADVQAAAFLTLMSGLTEYLVEARPRPPRHDVRQDGPRRRTALRRRDDEAPRSARNARERWSARSTSPAR